MTALLSPSLIPVRDLSDFAKLKDEQKDEVIALAKVMREIDSARRKTGALRAAAGRRNMSYGTLRRLYYGDTQKRRGVSVHRDGWVHTGWRALVNRAKASPVARELPQSFLDFWLELRLQFQREQTGKAAHAALIARWRQWRGGDEARAIPGYDAAPPADPYTGEPAGWSYANLMNYKPKALEAAAMRQGRGAALDYRVSIITSRVGLKVGQYVQFDDQLYDVAIDFLGVNREAGLRPLGLDAIDVASAGDFGHAFLPVTVDLVTGKKVQLKAKHAHWFIAHVLMTKGFRTDTGTIFVLEHGTMAASDEFKEQAHRATGDHLQFRESGIIDNRAFAGMFAGEGGGNFKFKALLEGSRVRLRNHMSALPGATGLNPSMAPEEHYHGLRRAETKVLRWMESLPPERAMKVAHYTMEYHTFVRLALDLYATLEADPDHELEGWIENEWTETLWRHSLESDQWMPMSALHQIPNATLREGMAAIVTSMPGLRQTNRLSRRQVRLQHEHELTQVRGAAVPILLGREAALELTVDVEEPLFTVQDQELFPSPVHYLARLRQSREVLKRGEKYLVYVDPFGARFAEVCDLDNRWLGTCELWDRPTLSDTEALGKRFGLASAVFNEELKANVPRWALPTTEARVQIAEHNTRLAQEDARARTDRATGRHEKSAREFGAVLRQQIPEAAPAGTGSEDAEVWPDAPVSQPQTTNPNPTPDLEVW